MSHGYVLQKHSPTSATLSCSACGVLLSVHAENEDEIGQVVSKTIELHDAHHAELRRQAREAAGTPLPTEHEHARSTLPTDAEIYAWLEGPEPRIWEPSFEERRGHVAVALGHVVVDEILERIPPQPSVSPFVHRIRIEDTNGRTSDHAIETHVSQVFLAQKLNADPRVKRAWAVAS